MLTMRQYECCSFIIDTWIESVAQDRTNIAPKNIPWDILCVLITEMYGGKIDNEGDFKALNSLVKSFMTPATFEENYNVVKEITDSTDTLTLPNGIGWEDFMGWVNDLPEREPPTYLGLPANAEKLLLVGQAKQMMDKLRLIMGILDEGAQVMAEANDE